MRHHQKYFSVEDADGKLAPQFVAVMNTSRDPEGWCGGQRARAAGALQRRAVLLGRRSEEEAGRSCSRSGARDVPGEAGSTWKRPSACWQLVAADSAATRIRRPRGASSSKCDLTTELVKEFTELQGVVGGLYARAQGEPEAVWQAIYDHYKPVSMEDSIPRTSHGPDRRAGRQARHAARLLPRSA